MRSREISANSLFAERKKLPTASISAESSEEIFPR
jgi:hypothetical protein